MVTTHPETNILLMGKILHHLGWNDETNVGFIPVSRPLGASQVVQDFFLSTVAPENRPSQKKTIVFQPSIFRRYVSFMEGKFAKHVGYFPPDKKSLTASPPEKWCLEDEFPFGFWPGFRGELLNFRSVIRVNRSAKKQICPLRMGKGSQWYHDSTLPKINMEPAKITRPQKKHRLPNRFIVATGCKSRYSFLSGVHVTYITCFPTKSSIHPFASFA